MPTAILRFFTTAGFVVGADGKIQSGEKTESDKATKIFQLPGLHAAYALYGEIGIGDDDPDTPVTLDLAASLKEIVSARTEMPSGLYSYGREIERKLRTLLLDAQARGAIFHGFGAVPPYGTGLAQIVLYGFITETPEEVLILFAHRDQVLTRPNVFSMNLRTGPNPEIWGSHEVARRLFPQRESEQISPLDAAKAIERYIRMCDSPEGHAIDSFCSNIGGHVHVALITPNSFEWLKAPVTAL